MAQSPTDLSLPFFVTIPHSGEQVPPEVTWLSGLQHATFLRDVDRFVDELYKPALQALHIPFVDTTWHRYVIDLNRDTGDVDQASVIGASEPVGTHPKGLHWSVTTHGERLIPQPMTRELHQHLIQNYYDPFHSRVQRMFETFRNSGAKRIFHLDAHSMPSKGTALHSDPGSTRPEIVVSDLDGRSCMPEYCDLVVEAYKKAGFEVGINWPYKGGGITVRYGQPSLGQHTLQVEMNRALYMDEETKEKKGRDFENVQNRIQRALTYIQQGLAGLQESEKP